MVADNPNIPIPRNPYCKEKQGGGMDVYKAFITSWPVRFLANSRIIRAYHLERERTLRLALGDPTSDVDEWHQREKTRLWSCHAKRDRGVSE